MIWYISTTGSDTTGDGSIGTPYATVGKCITVGADGDTVKVVTGTYTITSTTNITKQVSIISNSGVKTDVIFDANCTIFNVQSSNVSITYMTLQSSSIDALVTIDRMSTGTTLPTFFTGITISNNNLKYTGTALSLNGTFTINTNAFTRSSGTNTVDVIKLYSCRGISSISSNTLTDAESIRYFAYLTNTGSGTYLDRCNSKGGALSISSNNITYTHASQSMTFIFQDYFNQYSYGTVGTNEQYNINTKLYGTFNSNTITSDNVKCRFGLVSVSSNTDLDSLGNITITGNTLNNTDYGAWHLDKNTSSHSVVSLTTTRPMFKIYSNTLDTYVFSVESINPNTGSYTGGTPLTITGTSFSNAVSVSIGGNLCTSFVVVNNTTITCTTSVNNTGLSLCNVVVTNSSSNISTLTNGFTYIFSFTNYQNANLVVGQPDFTTSGAGTAINKLNSPRHGLFIYNNYLYIADRNNHRVMIFNKPTSSNPNAIGVLGQNDFITSSSGCTNNKFSSPAGISVCPTNGKFYLCDSTNARILVYNTPPIAQVNADAVIGKTNFTTSGGSVGPRSFNTPVHLRFVGSKAILADRGNNRILIWNDFTTYDQNSTIPDLVLGQNDFTSNTALVPPTASSFNSPNDPYADANKLIISDSNNHRILIWTTFPTSNNQPANLVLGQSDFITRTTGLSQTAMSLGLVGGISSDGIKLVLADANNSRILIWTSIPTSNNQPADKVLGQPDFISSSVRTTQNGVNLPMTILLYNNEIYLQDTFNHRVVQFIGS